jgi:DNA-binding LytR/AlgR family response regulator
MNSEKSNVTESAKIKVQVSTAGTDGHLVNGKNMKANKKHNSFSREENTSAAKQENSRIIPLKDHTENRQVVRKEKKSRAGSYGPKLELDDRIFVTVNSVSRFIKVRDIQCIKAEKDYTYICTVDDKKLLVLRPMIEWEERLPVKYFARIHRSTIVNLELIEKVEKWFNYSYHVYLKNVDEPFQMSRRYALKLKERFR